MAPARFTGPRAAAAVSIPAASEPAKKPRKPRAPKERPPGMSNKEWIAERSRLETANIKRRGREAAQRQRQLMAQLQAEEQAAAEEDELEEEEEVPDEPPTPAAAPLAKKKGPFGPRFAGWKQSPSPSPRMSPHPPPAWFVEGDSLGGFNPNLTFPYHPPMMYGNAPGYAASPSHRRAILAGLQPQDSYMEEIIASGSMAAAASPGFLDASGEFFTQVGGDYGEGGSGTQATEEQGEDDDVDETPVVPESTDPAGEGRKRRGPGRPRKEPKVPVPPAEPRIKWLNREDSLLAEAWKTVSLDPIIGANQHADNYWKRVKTAYDERRMIDPYYAPCVLDRGQKAMANHWANIQASCNKWHGIQEEISARPQSGANREMEIVRMLEAYKNDEGTDFKFLHVFVLIEDCEKWAEVRRSIGKGKEYVPDAVAACASEGRPPMGHKKAKLARDGAPAAAKLQASIETCIADAQVQAGKREEVSKQRWAALMANSQVKIDLLRTGTAAKKRNNDLAFLTGGDPAAMTPEVRAWFLAQCNLILTDISAPPAPTSSGGASYTTAPTSPPAAQEDAAVDKDAQPVVDLENGEPAVRSDAVIDLDAAPSSPPAPTPADASV